ncbi:MAG: DUF881 domain-containing protein [Chloroflexi bacterium]|nr:DUF881 domain-containing protein [Chloroflexota bacterium]
MRNRLSQVSLTFVAILLGVLLVMQLRVQGRIAKSVEAQSATDQATMISNLYDSNLSLRKEVARLSAELDQYQDAPGQNDLDAMLREQNKLRIANGSAKVSGPGVEMTVVADLRSEDLQDLVNEFRNAGAEAIAVNEQRVVFRSAVGSHRSGLTVNNVQLNSPYSLYAIGQADTLERALTRKGGLLTYLETTYPNARINISKRTRMVLPAYQADFEWQYATPTK